MDFKLYRETMATRHATMLNNDELLLASSADTRVTRTRDMLHRACSYQNLTQLERIAGLEEAEREARKTAEAIQKLVEAYAPRVGRLVCADI